MQMEMWNVKFCIYIFRGSQHNTVAAISETTEAGGG